MFNSERGSISLIGLANMDRIQIGQEKWGEVVTIPSQRGVPQKYERFQSAVNYQLHKMGPVTSSTTLVNYPRIKNKFRSSYSIHFMDFYYIERKFQ